MRILNRLFILSLIAISVLAMSGCVSKKLLIKPVDKLEKVVVSYYGADGKVDREIAVANEEKLARELYAKVVQTQAKTISDPKEMDSQESSPQFFITFYYSDATNDKVYSTETGQFIYRRLGGNGWVGGYNGQVLALVTELDKNDSFSFSLHLVKRPVPANFRGVSFRQWDIEKQPVLTQKDNAHSWDGNVLKVNRGILSEKLWGEVPTSGRPFVLLINGKRVYGGEFWTALSSLSPPGDGTIIFYDIPPEGGDVVLYKQNK